MLYHCVEDPSHILFCRVVACVDVFSSDSNVVTCLDFLEFARGLSAHCCFHRLCLFLFLIRMDHVFFKSFFCMLLAVEFSEVIDYSFSRCDCFSFIVSYF